MEGSASDTEKITLAKLRYVHAKKGHFEAAHP